MEEGRAQFLAALLLVMIAAAVVIGISRQQVDESRSEFRGRLVPDSVTLAEYADSLSEFGRLLMDQGRQLCYLGAMQAAKDPVAVCDEP